ncbi:MAG TPA: phosphatidylglycerophosphatase A [Acetobacteraceae bacterium]|jgi:phosphatidylglycerophosphatase A|nr:phosphatidylglycerophosphatase A [Acetobacteraceae bacterium]
MTLARIIASGLGSGHAPRAPGTVASLLAVLLGIPLMRAPSGTLALATAAASLGGLWAIRAAKVDGDPGWVVIDEVAGQWLALLGLARPTALGLLAAFTLFRLLDIAKPGPIGWADRQGGASGIMADDLLAGALVAGVLWAARTHWPMFFS